MTREEQIRIIKEIDGDVFPCANPIAHASFAALRAIGQQKCADCKTQEWAHGSAQRADGTVCTFFVPQQTKA